MKLYNPQYKEKIKLPGDKSLSHRALIMAAMSNGVSVFENLSTSEDVNSTKKCLEQLEVKIEVGETTKVYGVGPKGFKKPSSPLDCENSGTTMRLLMGVLAAQDFESVLIGDKSLSKRPMLRVAEPLRLMGAKINLSEGNFAPVVLEPSVLKDLDYELPIASAQVKSALMLAAWASGISLNLTGLLKSRDHTERMLPHFVSNSVNWKIPSDISAACQWLTMAILSKKPLRLENVLLNEHRLGFVKLLQDSGVEIFTEITNNQIEPLGTIELRSAQLNPFRVTKEMVPSLIDEIPLLVLLATQANGITIISGAEELKYKETDRIEKTAELLQNLGLVVQTTQDGFIVQGAQNIKSGVVDSFGDHRLAMLGVVASFSGESIEIKNSECIKISDPHFLENLV